MNNADIMLHRIRRGMIAVSLAASVVSATSAGAGTQPHVVPRNGARHVNPDTHIVLTFASPARIGSSGTITVHDATDDAVVDTLDLAIPASPNPSGRAMGTDGATKAPEPLVAAGPDHPEYQFTRVGGSYFHFFPVIVHGNTATISLHNGALKYGHRYIVRIGDGVFPGQPDAIRSWTFETKAAPPSSVAGRIVVAADGRGDFNTVQGAIDFAPAVSATPLTISIRNGNYEEIVNLAGKSNIIFRGQSRRKVIVGYANNSAFNRNRPAFSVTDANDIQLSAFTINNYFVGQAEALLMRGQRNVIDRMTLNGSGDAFTTSGTIYMVDSQLTGDGDTILGYAALYCLRCDIRSVGPFTWTRTPKGSHGNVFVDSIFRYLDKPLPWSIVPSNPSGRKTPGVFARLPRNGPAGFATVNFPYAEMVLIDAKTQGIPPEGWGPVEAQPALDWSNIHFWEYNTMDLDGRPVDLSARHPAVRRLTLATDSDTIARYRSPEFVLGGWKPVIR